MNPLKIGNIIGVDGDGIEVVMTTSEMMVEHEGRSYRIGQLGSYVIVPMDDKTLVGFVVRIGRQDTTTIDVEPETVMHVQLVGVIKDRRFSRGLNEYPTVGDDVWLAVQKDFETIFGSFDQLLSGTDHPLSFSLGQFALNRDFEVRVLGKEFFSKHVAVLGNSGSGKSCTTAKIIQEILKLSSAQVILFDLHGEYRAAFSDEEGNLDDNVICLGEQDLVLPYWMLSYDELEQLFVDRSEPALASAQVSFLKTAMRKLKGEAAKELKLTSAYTIDTPVYFSLELLHNAAQNFNEARYIVNTSRLAFAKLSRRSMDPAEQEELMWTRRCQFNKGNAEGETPHPDLNSKILGLINQIETRLNDRRFNFLLRPMEQAKQSRYFRNIIDPERSPGELSKVAGHLIKLMTGQGEPRANLTIVDLSGIPFEVVDMTVAVLTRTLFDFNFWCPPDKRHPLLLVFEEAHNYIPCQEQVNRFARRSVERVAKEGRKYGVSAMVISQRPSELSETVLSQCNNMVLMRMNNPNDQDYVTRVVSEQFANLIRTLPIMKPGEGFIVGDSVLMPLRTLIDLPVRTPHSADVDFFKHWSREAPDLSIDEVLSCWWRQDRSYVNGVVPAKGQTAKAQDSQWPGLAAVTAD